MLGYLNINDIKILIKLLNINTTLLSNCIKCTYQIMQGLFTTKEIDLTHQIYNHSFINSSLDRKLILNNTTHSVKLRKDTSLKMWIMSSLQKRCMSFKITEFHLKSIGIKNWMMGIVFLLTLIQFSINPVIWCSTDIKDFLILLLCNLALHGWAMKCVNIETVE